MCLAHSRPSACFQPGILLTWSSSCSDEYFHFMEKDTWVLSNKVICPESQSWLTCRAFVSLCDGFCPGQRPSPVPDPTKHWGLLLKYGSPCRLHFLGLGQGRGVHTRCFHSTPLRGRCRVSYLLATPALHTSPHQLCTPCFPATQTSLLATSTARFFTPPESLVYLPRTYFTLCSFCLKRRAPFLCLAKNKPYQGDCEPHVSNAWFICLGMAASPLFTPCQRGVKFISAFSCPEAQVCKVGFYGGYRLGLWRLPGLKSSSETLDK